MFHGKRTEMKMKHPSSLPLHGLTLSELLKWMRNGLAITFILGTCSHYDDYSTGSRFAWITEYWMCSWPGLQAWRPPGQYGRVSWSVCRSMFLCLALQEMDYTFFISKFILYYAKYLFNWHSFSVHSSYFPAMSVQHSSFQNMTLDLYCKWYS